MATECNNKKHSAAFPEELPTWFIKLFTKEGDVVLDPFLGSGTTVVVAKKMNRNYFGIDILPEYVDLAKSYIDSVQMPLFAIAENKPEDQYNTGEK
jgi:site-specific DNA-methyltransferase (adenine-specific)/site-specific DNA-methyltransferase (cytosine-N4-specific)